LACLQREMDEEMGTAVAIESAHKTHLVYEQTVADAVALDGQTCPAPMLCTISQNLHLRDRHRESEILAIVTFGARLLEPPVLKDLFGLLVIPRTAVHSVFDWQEIALDQLCAIRGVRVIAQESLPEDMLLRPVWTARSFQLLLHAGELPSAGLRSRS